MFFRPRARRGREPDALPAGLVLDLALENPNPTRDLIDDHSERLAADIRQEDRIVHREAIVDAAIGVEDRYVGVSPERELYGIPQRRAKGHPLRQRVR